MTFTLELLTLLTGTVMTMVYHCNADSLPPPTRLSPKWLDPFTVNVSWSWEKPSNLPEGCDIKFEFEGKDVRRTHKKFFTDSCLTEETDANHWNYTIRTTSSKPCDGWDDSGPVHAVFNTAKPRAKVVKDLKCFPDPSGMNCSWIPVNKSLNLTLSYRKCGYSSEELIKSLKECDRYYTNGARDGCYLKVGADTDICISAATGAASMTFKPLLALHSPNFTVERKENNLQLSWQPQEVGKGCVWIYELCFTECGKENTCQNITKEGEVFKTQMSYDENCRYEFRSRVITEKFCPKMSSNFGNVVLFGDNKPPDESLTVAAIIVPIVLSLCVMLSCYCFRRHSDIICPAIPDPSAIFKDMMMSGNKELKSTTGNLYTPVLESTEPCKLVRENCDPQQIV